MIDFKHSGLDFNEPLILSMLNGSIKKRKIGDFVDSYLTDDEKNKDKICKEIPRVFVTSINPKSYTYELSGIEGVFREKTSVMTKITFDDNSHITLKNNTKLFNYNNGKISRLTSKKLRINDYLPLSEYIPIHEEEIRSLNLLEYNTER
ncbi:hypothetical protein EU534_00985, partial [Candidatus Heimdallarchaeota archaeon]